MEKKYINSIIRIKGNDAYYFDENGILSSINVQYLNEKTYKNYFFVGGNYGSNVIEIDGVYESRYFVFVLSQLELGDSFEKFIKIFKNQETKKII